MKPHGRFEIFTIGPIIFIKLIDNTNIDCIRGVRKAIVKFRETQESKVLYVADLTEWEFAPPEAIEFMKANQKLDSSDGLLKVIVFSNNKLITELVDSFITSHENRDNMYSFVSNQNELYMQIQDLGYPIEQFKNKYENFIKE